MRGARSRRPLVRLFAVNAAISLVPILVLGAVLALSLRNEARRRGVAEGSSEAALVARAGVEPVLAGQPLSAGLQDAERDGLARLVGRAVVHGDVLRLRVRGLDGRVVYSDDGSGMSATPDDEAVKAAKGKVVARLTRLNTDKNDRGPTGVAAVEVYRVLTAGDPAKPVGVLEVYLPYAPISKDVSAGLHTVYLDLAAGLGVLYLALLAVSVTVSRSLRREVKHNAFLAEHDHLTDLPNRTLFHRRAEAALKTAGHNGEKVAIAIFDLDRFKDVNDTLGHYNGDRLLTELARRLDINTRPEDTVARLGGDEFGVILTGVTDAEEALWRLRDVLDREFEVSGLPLSVDASIGYVVAPEDGSDVDDLLQRADVAMYDAKSSHAGVVRYDPENDEYDAAKLGLISELRRAIDNDELVLHYQPKAALRNGRIEAVEALLRWRHPTRGLLLPDTFLPLAEQTDLIDKLTDWVLARALADLDGLSRTSPRLAVAVNVSARSLSRADFATRIERALGRAGVAPSRLIIEITETALLADPTRAATVLTQLDASGVRVSLDDFGKGQTSLGYLSALPVHELKIDKSFVSDMLDNPAHAAIVRSIVDLGHNLQLRVVAEGVETEDVLTALTAAGCDIAQGYLVARPMPYPALGSWLRGHRSGGPSRAPTRRRPLRARPPVPA